MCHPHNIRLELGDAGLEGLNGQNRVKTLVLSILRSLDLLNIIFDRALIIVHNVLNDRLSNPRHNPYFQI